MFIQFDRIYAVKMHILTLSLIATLYVTNHDTRHKLQHFPPQIATLSQIATITNCYVTYITAYFVHMTFNLINFQCKPVSIYRRLMYIYLSISIQFVIPWRVHSKYFFLSQTICKLNQSDSIITNTLILTQSEKSSTIEWVFRVSIHLMFDVIITPVMEVYYVTCDKTTVKYLI